MRSNSKEPRNVSDGLGVGPGIDDANPASMRCPFADHQSTEPRGNANPPPIGVRFSDDEDPTLLLEPTVLPRVLDEAPGAESAKVANMAIPAIEQNEDLVVLGRIHEKALEASSLLANHSPISHDLRRDDEKTYDGYFGIDRVDGDASVFIHAVIAAFGRAYQCDGMEDFDGLPWLRAGERELLRLAIQDQALYSEGHHE